VRVIDLRSDTVTKPTRAMRRAMAEAEVGDDVYGEDPTVNQLQEKAAVLLGTEAAIFVPSGTMGNQIAVKLHTQPGDEVITEELSHIYNFEMGAMAAISGALPRPIPVRDGAMEVGAIRKAIRPKNYHRSQTALITVENTYNFGGGSLYSIERSREVTDFAKEAGIKVHLDGARIFNAAVALGCAPKELAQGFDSVMFCVSKGLCAPVGSLLCGSRAFIDKARSIRKLLGGAMRQVGILAAAGIVALDEMIDRLAEDHENAHVIAENLSLIEGIRIEPDKVKTNVVIFEITRPGMSSHELVAALAEHKILSNPVDDSHIRFLTHNDVSREDCLRACEAIGQLVHA
jgi:threonine aldolase